MDQPWWGGKESLALTISEAARICGIKRRAIRRRHRAGDFANSFKDAEGTWRIPVTDLVAAGLQPDLVAAGLEHDLVADPDEPRLVSAATSQMERLRTEVAVLRERVRALQIIAREREERVDDLRTILRMLPAPSEAGEAPQAAPPTEAAEAAPPPRAEAAPSPPIDEAPVTHEVEEEILPGEAREVMAPPRAPSPAPVTPRPQRAASPFDAPARASSSTATASPASPAGGESSARPDRTAPSGPRREPILVLPDPPAPEPVGPEDALQRPAASLENDMSHWWPAPPSWPAHSERAQPEAWSPSPPGAGPEEQPGAVSDSAGGSEERRDEPLWGSDEVAGPEGESSRRDDLPASPPQGEEWAMPSDQRSTSPAPPERAATGRAPQPVAPTDADPFSADQYDEAAFDWMDPDYGRPPRHLRRRLGRFFRRYRRPR